MDTSEAKNIVEIMLTADGGCSHCARELLDSFVSRFPQFLGLARSCYAVEYDTDDVEDIGYDIEHPLQES